MKKRTKFGLPAIIFVLALATYFFISERQNKVDTENLWPAEASTVKIPSSRDHTEQPAYFVSSDKPSPLIISLHQWSATYSKYDVLVEHAIENNWNYIRPNFRGPNKHAEAGGSDLVISDIDDAIDYAIENGNVDEDYIHIIGTSGGGHAALQHLMTSQKKVASYSAWVPITDLVAWYGESKVRGNFYSDDILTITDSQNGRLNIQEARRRSPIHQPTPVDKASQTTIQIYAGVNDGYDGSVPISHSIQFYNKLVRDLEYGEQHAVPQAVSSELLYTQSVTEELGTQLLYGKRDIIYNKKVNNLSLVIFDGNHEILSDEAFKSILERYELANEGS